MTERVAEGAFQMPPRSKGSGDRENEAREPSTPTTERLPTLSDETPRNPGGSVWAEIVREVEALGDPQEAPRTLAYGELVEHVLALESEVAALRALFKGLRGELAPARPPLPSGALAEIARNHGGPRELGTTTESTGRSPDSSSFARPDELVSPGPVFSSRGRDDIALKDASTPDTRREGVAWSGADRTPCPRGCGTLVRRDNLSRHLKRCLGSPSSPGSSGLPDE
jgi:hypothetical protein